MEISPIFLQDLDENLASRLKITVIENFQKKVSFFGFQKISFAPKCAKNCFEL